MSLKVCNFNVGCEDGFLDFKRNPYGKRFIQNIISDEKPDIFFLQEVENIDLVFLSQNHEIISNGQVAVLVNNSIFHKFQKIEIPVDFGTDDDSSRIVHVNFFHKESNKEYLCVCVHVPRKDNPKKENWPRTNALRHCKGVFEGSFNKKFKLQPDVTILGGDFNTSIFIYSKGLRSKPNKRKNPMSTYHRYLITDPSKETTLNGLSIDAMYCKLNQGDRSWLHECSMKKIEDDLLKFDHFMQITKLDLSDVHFNGRKNKENLVEDDGEEEPSLESVVEKNDVIQDGDRVPDLVQNVEKMVEAVLIKKVYRLVQTGPRGGRFYTTGVKNPCYIQDRKSMIVPESKIGTEETNEQVIQKVKEERLLQNQSKLEKEMEIKTESLKKEIIIHGKMESNNEQEQKTPPKVEAILVGKYWRPVLVGPRGGKYYMTSGGSKVYCTAKPTEFVPLSKLGLK